MDHYWDLACYQQNKTAINQALRAKYSWRGESLEDGTLAVHFSRRDSSEVIHTLFTKSFNSADELAILRKLENKEAK